MGKKKNVILGLIGLLLLMIAMMVYLIMPRATISKNEVFKNEIFQTLDSTTNPTFQFKTLEGKVLTIEASPKEFKIKEMQDKIVFLKIFGWDCHFCKKEIPELIKLKNDLPDMLDIVAVEAQQHSVEESKQFVKEYGINYSIVQGEEQESFYSYLQEQYGWSGVIPLTIVVGKDGHVLAFELGAKSYTLAELMKASLLREK
jgi:thiol-disulfide isomerase/thioredoxin